MAGLKNCVVLQKTFRELVASTIGVDELCLYCSALHFYHQSNSGKICSLIADTSAYKTTVKAEKYLECSEPIDWDPSVFFIILAASFRPSM